MSSPPNHEVDRLEALRQYQILDTAPEAAFDDITRLVAQICETPIALISLIDECRQWFKAKVGLEAGETSRDVAFCSHAIRQPQAVLIVPDTLKDDRFASNPLVTAAPHIRFYAGAPLITPTGYALGTLCVLDQVPRQLNAEQVEALRTLSRQVVTQLELRQKLSELVRAKQEHQQAESQLRLLAAAVQHANETILITTGNLQPPGPEIVFVNPAFTRMTGYAAEEVLGQSPRILQGPHTNRATLDAVRETLSRGQYFDGDAVNYRKDGTEYVVEWHIAPIKHESGETTHYVAIQRDITDRKRKEAELYRQHQRSQLLAEVSLKIRQSLNLGEILQTAVSEVQQILQADRVLILRLGPDRSAKVITEAVVAGWASVIGQGITDDCLGEVYLQKHHQGRIYTMTDVEHAEVEPCLIEFLRQFAVKAKLVVPIFLQEELWGLLIVHQCAYPRQWSSFEIELLQQLANQLNIALTQAQLLEQETRQRQELVRANQELETFSYSVSHDLRAPLRTMDGFSRLLLEDYAPQLPPKAQRYLQWIREGAEEMGRLINDLLTFSRLSRQPLKKQVVAPETLVQRVLADLQVEQAERRIEISIGYLPPCEADPVLLKQVFINLLSNALKFTAQRQVAQIAIGANHAPSATAASEWVYFVKDNGVGFDMQYSHKLFGVFQRLHRAEEYEGTGVGLAIAQQIIHRHGGRIWAEAVVDRGATFYFTLGGRPYDLVEVSNGNRDETGAIAQNTLRERIG